jgi:hypothetical protein
MKFGMRAQAIKNSVTLNRNLSAADLTILVKKLTKELDILKSYVLILEKELVEAKQGTSFDLQLLKKKVRAHRLLADL